MSGIWIPTFLERKSIQERYFFVIFEKGKKNKKITLQGKQKDKDFYLSKNGKHDFQKNTVMINLPEKSGIHMVQSGLYLNDLLFEWHLNTRPKCPKSSHRRLGVSHQIDGFKFNSIQTKIIVNSERFNSDLFF